MTQSTETVSQLTRPIIGIENRTPLEVFDIMCDRIDHAARISTNKDETIARLEAENARLREALTPSGATKAAYIGEFHMGITLRHRGQEDFRRVPVEWTTIKEIMSAISERAALASTEKEG